MFSIYLDTFLIFQYWWNSKSFQNNNLYSTHVQWIKKAFPVPIIELTIIFFKCSYILMFWL